MIPGKASKNSLRKSEHGVALITVLMILVFLSVVSIYTAETQNLSLRRTQNIIENEQAFQVAAGGEQWAVKILEKDIADDQVEIDNDSDNQTENWANLGGAVKVEVTQSYMLVTLFDQHGKLNLNNLVLGKPVDVPGKENGSGSENSAEETPDGEDSTGESENTDPGQEQENEQLGEQGVGERRQETSWYDVFVSAFVALGLDPELVNVIVDWIDSDSAVTGTSGAEDLYYSSLDAPYLVANQPMVSLAELVNLKGFSSEVLDTLLPYVTVIPVPPGTGSSRLNVNTASTEVLALISGNPQASADHFIPLIELREQQPFRNIEEFTDAYQSYTPYTLKPGMVKLLSVQSEYFISRICVESGRVKLGHYSLLRKNRDKENVTVHYRQSRSGCPDLAGKHAERT